MINNFNELKITQFSGKKKKPEGKRCVSMCVCVEAKKKGKSHIDKEKV